MNAFTECERVRVNVYKKAAGKNGLEQMRYRGIHTYRIMVNCTGFTVGRVP